MAALRRGLGALSHLLPLVQNNVSRSSSVMQLASRFTTISACRVPSPTISTVTKLGSSLEYRFVYAHKLAALKSMVPQAPSFQQPARTLTYCSIRKGKRKTVKAVVKRFLRLHCGLWLRRKAGYKKKLWKKSADRKRRLRQHVFCNKTQSKLLDKMTTEFWKRRNWYVNDPYQNYHDRTNLKV
ncbi:39S ribosomal protein L35, mitochondrial [Amblyraja radiata]|uniref:39S ribosomal protein L35, mitochondrial n=1 Tax=Amblyraja radiata TaxID=386614 RepID=UPI0014025E17|nr:39S ribosomal protein L35, mitochondrial [Amblyraja radiata]